LKWKRIAKAKPPLLLPLAALRQRANEQRRMSDNNVRIIKKKVAGHGGHHGGAWKVAYADFVTAMMALFIVLWLMNSSKQVQDAVSGYFKDPAGTASKRGSSVNGPGNQNLMVSKENMDKLKEELQQSIRKVKEFDKLKDQIEMTVTAEGLRIELLETAKGTFFDVGSPTPNDDCKDLLKSLAAELGKLPNKLYIEGHTDSQPYSGAGNYGNWELSTDRANAARHVVQEFGVRPDQVTQVRGYADQKLRKQNSPQDASNRRISFIVQYVDKPDDKDEKAEAKPAQHGETPKPGGQH
jgi:chemotaxis protein MotB